MSDGGDDAAAILSQSMEEAMHILCTYYGNQDITRRVEHIFYSKLKPAQIERYVHLPGAETAAGVEIQVFPPGSELHVAGDPLHFELGICPGKGTIVDMYNDAGVMQRQTYTRFNPGPAFPNRLSFIEYVDNKLKVYTWEGGGPPAESDGGDDAAAVLSPNMQEIRDGLCAYYDNEALNRRVEQIFSSKLRPAQMARYVRLLGADTQAGVEIQVFPPGSDLYVADDAVQFSFHIRPGERTFYSLEEEDDEEHWTESVFLPGPPFPDHWVEYHDNKLNVSQVTAPAGFMEVDGGDGPMVAFVDLCA